MRRIAIIGASGFVGSTLVERFLPGGDDIVACIHSSGNAWRIARLGIELRPLDLLDRFQVDAALSGVTHVINCARGGDEVMLVGLKNLLRASRRLGVTRFVHLSSVAVYGDPPPPESAHESAPTMPARGSYGWVKLAQDRMVRNACREGLRGVILCPPNISGAQSSYLVALVDALRAGTFALLDDGSAACSLVDVSNLCFAIELALDGPSDGGRLFVTDDENTDWRSVIEGLRPLLPVDWQPRTIARDELERMRDAPERPPVSLARSLKHLVSSDMRQALRRDPLWERIDQLARRGVARLGKPVEAALRLSIEGPLKAEKLPAVQSLNARLCRQQLRGVFHSCDLAKAQLGYRPPYSVAQSMAAFRTWYRSHLGMDLDTWPLLRELRNA